MVSFIPWDRIRSKTPEKTNKSKTFTLDKPIRSGLLTFEYLFHGLYVLGRLLIPYITQPTTPFLQPKFYLEDHPMTSKWLITMDSKSPNWGYSPYKWPFHGS